VTTTPEGGRVLGCLVEKQLTTPQQYPLTLNALSLACNQATNRDPVVALDDDKVLLALQELRDQRLIRVVLPSHGRSVKRYRHALDEVYGIEVPSLALLAVLLLRGPQTPGELRARCERMTEFPTVAVVQEQLDVLAAHHEELVGLLPRRPGQKEDRWQQTVAEPWAESTDPTPGPRPGPSGDGTGDSTGDDRQWPDPRGQLEASVAVDPGSDSPAREGDVETLREEVATLRASVAELGASLDALRRSLGG
jgi:uncharacterized protein